MKRNNESGPPKPEKLCRELRNNFYGEQKQKSVFVVDCRIDAGSEASGASLTSSLPNFS